MPPFAPNLISVLSFFSLLPLHHLPLATLCIDYCKLPRHLRTISPSRMPQDSDSITSLSPLDQADNVSGSAVDHNDEVLPSSPIPQDEESEHSLSDAVQNLTASREEDNFTPKGEPTPTQRSRRSGRSNWTDAGMKALLASAIGWYGTITAIRNGFELMLNRPDIMTVHNTGFETRSHVIEHCEQLASVTGELVKQGRKLDFLGCCLSHEDLADTRLCLKGAESDCFDQIMGTAT